MWQRHPIQNGATMFVTTNTKNRKSHFSNPAYAREAIEVLYRVQKQHSFILFGFVIMPDHCHFLLLPELGSISKIMRQFKSGLSHSIGMGPLWQSRFHLKVPDDSGKALQYIYLNPVKAGLVDEPACYPWSSINEKWPTSPLVDW